MKVGGANNRGKKGWLSEGSLVCLDLCSSLPQRYRLLCWNCALGKEENHFCLLTSPLFMVFG